MTDANGRYFDLNIIRYKLTAVAEMFLVDTEGALDFHSDTANGVHAILSDICEDLRKIEKEGEGLPAPQVTA